MEINKPIFAIINYIMFITMRFFVGSKISYLEIKKRRYDNDNLYSIVINNWESAVFLHDREQNRADLLQSKLAGLLSILSIFVSLFSLTGAITPHFPIIIQIICLVLSFLGLIYSIGPLTISTIYVADLDKFTNTNDFNADVNKEMRLAITDMGCRSDFHADCLKIAKTIIFISMTLYIAGVFIGLYRPSESSTSKASNYSALPVTIKIDTLNNSNNQDSLSAKTKSLKDDSGLVVPLKSNSNISDTSCIKDNNPKPKSVLAKKVNL
jgi:hypothetical protein